MAVYLSPALPREHGGELMCILVGDSGPEAESFAMVTVPLAFKNRWERSEAYRGDGYRLNSHERGEARRAGAIPLTADEWETYQQQSRCSAACEKLTPPLFGGES